MSVNYNNSEIKQEMRKIRAYACGNRQVEITPEERAGIARSTARERADLPAEQAREARVAAGRCAAAARYVCRRNCGGDCMRLLRYEQERRNAFEDPTIFYRFADQTYCNLLTGRSNINITELSRESLDIQDILEKYKSKRLT